VPASNEDIGRYRRLFYFLPSFSAPMEELKKALSSLQFIDQSQEKRNSLYNCN